MAKLIKNQQIIDDAWQLLADEADTDPATVTVPAGHWLVPFAVWQAQPALAARGDVAPVLKGTDDPAELAGQLDAVPLVAVDFPVFPTAAATRPPPAAQPLRLRRRAARHR